MKKIIVLLSLFTIQLYSQCNIKSISMGAYKVTALKEDNTLYTWGYNNFYPGVVISPSQIGIDSDWLMIRTGTYHTLGIKSNGTLWAWGENYFGQLGISYNPNNNLSLPIQVGTDNDWKYICAGNTHSAAIKNNGTLWTWGRNVYGQLGNGTWTDSAIPTQVGTDTNWEFIETSVEMMAATKTDHTIWTWGNNEFGGLGDGTTIHRNTPSEVGEFSDWKSVKASRYYCLAIKNDNTLWAWGNNTFGQLGDGTNINKLTPIQIGNHNDWKEILTGEHHSLAIKNDGTLWSWGGNDFGQLGIGNQFDQNNPVQVGTERNWNKLGTGTYNSFAIKTDGVCWFWGRNNSGQLLMLTQPLTFESSPIQNTCNAVNLGVNLFSNLNLNIFPNPTSYFLNINNTTNKIVDKITISNANGQIIIENYFIKDKIDVSDLPNGLYIINISVENENVHLKFIKN